MVKITQLLAFAAAIVVPGQIVSAQEIECDRICLDGKLDAYLGAIMGNEPDQAPLAAGFRQTENSVVTPVGSGVWGSLTALGSLQRRYFDPQTGGAAFFGTVTDGGEDAIASLRLRVQHGQITEGEWHIAHEGDPGITGEGSEVVFNIAELIANPPPQRVVPDQNRLPRDRLIAVVNSYFDGIVAKNGRMVIAHGGCTRFENGFPAFGGPIRGDDPNDGFQGRQDCTSGYATLGGLVAARRYPMVDEQAQVVLASAVFDREPGDERRRNHFMEVFGVDDGRIRSVHAAMFYAPPEQPLPNWTPFYDGNFPQIVNPAPTD